MGSIFDFCHCITCLTRILAVKVVFKNNEEQVFDVVAKDYLKEF